MSEATSALLKLVLLLLLGVASVHMGKIKMVWKVGYEKIDGKCMPVGGSAEPDALPFPFASMGDCEKDIFADNFDSTAKRWDGIVLQDGECVQVWARARINPFVNNNFSECEKEKERMQTTLAISKGSLKATRDVAVNLDNLRFGKALVENLIRMAGTVFPKLNLFLTLLNALWPANTPNVWDQVKDQVKLVVNQKMNEAYAKHLKQFIAGLKGELDAYYELSDTHSDKKSKLVTIDTNLGIEEPKFMDLADPISTLTYWLLFVPLRSTVKMELVRISSPSEKQIYVKQHLKFLMRAIPYTGYVAYQELLRWRRSLFGCTHRTRSTGISSHMGSDALTFTFTDSWNGATETKNYGPSLSRSRTIGYGEAWCVSKQQPIINKVQAFIGVLREHIKAWASLFNTEATNPFVTGFSAEDGVMTTEGVECKFPFVYWGKLFSHTCSNYNHDRYWCNKQGGGWGNCYAHDKMDIDLTSCKMPTSSTEQYFGHKNVPTSGATCKVWTSQSAYTDFPMDNQNRTLASNYCRRTGNDANPWCYTEPTGTWSYCNIRECNAGDWARSG